MVSNFVAEVYVVGFFMSVLISDQLSSKTGPCYHSIHIEYSCKHYEVATLPPARFTKRYLPLPPPFPTQTDLRINHTYSPCQNGQNGSLNDLVVLTGMSNMVKKIHMN